MSKFKTQAPIVHIPSYKQWGIPMSTMLSKLKALNLSAPMHLLDSQYYYTDSAGWAIILCDLVFKSSLYKPDRFDCDNYALKAMSLCAERFGLNTMGMVIGNIPQGRHAFNIIYLGDTFLFWEPNEGFSWSGQPFPLGENGYTADLVLM